MGEISEALKRAKAARHRASGAPGAALPERERMAPSGGLSARAAAEAGPEGEEGESGEAVELSRERGPGWPARSIVVEPQGLVAESFRHLALEVRSALAAREATSLAVTGPLQAEGKTTVACNLALALASLASRRSVALVDLDLRAASLASALRLAPRAGIEEVLRGEAGLEEVRVRVSKPALDVYPCARPCEEPHQVLGSPGTARVLRELERRYAVVVCDTPPALLVSDTRLILNQVGAWMAVARSASTREQSFRRMLELLPREHFLGAALNDAALPGPMGYRGYYDYYGAKGRPEAGA